MPPFESPIDRRHKDDLEALIDCLNKIKQGKRACPLNKWVFPGKHALPFEEAFEKAKREVKDIIDRFNFFEPIPLYNPDFFKRFDGCLQVSSVIDNAVEKIFTILFKGEVHSKVIDECYKSARVGAREIRVLQDEKIILCKKVDSLRKSNAQLCKSACQDVDSLYGEIAKLKRELDSKKKDLKRLRSESKLAKDLVYEGGPRYGRRERKTRVMRA